MLSLLLISSFSLSAQASAESDDLKIGISKLMAHPALDDIERGIIDYLEENGVNAEYDLQNANGDISTAASIANVFRTEGVDIAIGIATPAAQALANAFEDIPVVFATVTDVEAAGLSGLDNVAGTSDEVPIKEHFSLIEQLTGAESIGMIYTSGEANGIASMERMKAVCGENGVSFISASVANSSEVRMAALSIIDRVDAMYVATDNTVISAISSLSEVCTEASVPLFSADTTSSFGTDVLVAGGFNYYQSGRQTGEIVLRILNGESPSEIGTEYLEDLDLYINTSVASRLGIEIPADMLENAAYVV